MAPIITIVAIHFIPNWMIPFSHRFFFLTIYCTPHSLFLALKYMYQPSYSRSYFVRTISYFAPELGFYRKCANGFFVRGAFYRVRWGWGLLPRLFFCLFKPSWWVFSSPFSPFFFKKKLSLHPIIRLRIKNDIEGAAWLQCGLEFSECVFGSWYQNNVFFVLFLQDQLLFHILYYGFLFSPSCVLMYNFHELVPFHSVNRQFGIVKGIYSPTQLLLPDFSTHAKACWGGHFYPFNASSPPT